MDWANGCMNTGTSVNIIISALVIRFLIFVVVGLFDIFRSAREKKEYQLRFCATIVRFSNCWRSKKNYNLEFFEFVSRSVVAFDE